MLMKCKINNPCLQQKRCEVSVHFMEVQYIVKTKAREKKVQLIW